VLLFGLLVVPYVIHYVISNFPIIHGTVHFLHIELWRLFIYQDVQKKAVLLIFIVIYRSILLKKIILRTFVKLVYNYSGSLTNS